MMRLVIGATVAAVLTSVAGAQTVSLVSSNPAPKKSGDPNRKICERVEKTGTRLGASTICLTAQQWHDLRLEDRQDLERAQKNIAIKSPLENG